MVAVRRAKGINDRVVRLLSEEVLYPEQEIVFVGKGQTARSDATRERGIVCVTNRTLTFYRPRSMMAEDFKLADVDNISHRKGLFTSKIELHVHTDNPIRAVIEGIPKKQIDFVFELIRRTVDERKKFEREQKAKGFFPYGLTSEKWGSQDEVRSWLRSHLHSRGFRKIEGRWMTRREHLDHQQRQRGLYRHIEVEAEKWGSLDEILDNLSPSKFEELLGTLFRSMGYETRNLPYVGDYGADLVIKKNGETMIIQAKKYSRGRKVGAQDVQKTLGALWKYNAKRALLITTINFTEKAYKQAQGAPVELWNRQKLKETLSHHLPLDLQESPKLVYLRQQDQLEETYQAIVSDMLSSADPQTAARVTFEVKRDEKKLTFNISGPLQFYPLFEKATEELTRTLPTVLKRMIQRWLNQKLREELGYFKTVYPFSF